MSPRNMQKSTSVKSVPNSQFDLAHVNMREMCQDHGNMEISCPQPQMQCDKCPTPVKSVSKNPCPRPSDTAMNKPPHGWNKDSDKSCDKNPAANIGRFHSPGGKASGVNKGRRPRLAERLILTGSARDEKVFNRRGLAWPPVERHQQGVQIQQRRNQP